MTNWHGYLILIFVFLLLFMGKILSLTRSRLRVSEKKFLENYFTNAIFSYDRYAFLAPMLLKTFLLKMNTHRYFRFRLVEFSTAQKRKYPNWGHFTYCKLFFSVGMVIYYLINHYIMCSGDMRFWNKNWISWDTFYGTPGTHFK